VSSSHLRTGPATNRGPYSYTLVEFVGPRARRRHTDFATLPELAIAAFLVTARATGGAWCPTSGVWPRHRLQAYGPRGETFDTCELFVWGRRLNCDARPAGAYFQRPRAPVAGYVRRQGPVPGVHKLHSYRWHRAPRTMNERRLNASSCRQHEEVEPTSRPGRNGYALPSDRDDIHRGAERTWKAQRKGRKAWDR